MPGVLGQVTPMRAPLPLLTTDSAGSRKCGPVGFSVTRPRGLQRTILGYENTVEQPDSIWSIMQSFPLNQPQYPEYTKEEHEGEQAGDKS